MLTRMRRVGLFLLVGGAGAVLAGCSSSSTLEAGAPTALGTGAQIGLASELVAPLNYFANGPGFTDDVQRSYEADIAACMRALGWIYLPRDDSLVRSEPSTVTELGSLRRSVGYSVPSTNGTGAVSAAPSESATAQNRAYVESLTVSERQRYLRDLNGGTSEATPVDPNPSGCRPKARNAIGADLPNRNREFANAWSESVQALLTDPAYLRGLDAWRSCMTRAGHTVETPDRAPAVAQQQSERAGDPASGLQAKLAIASSDFDCQVSELLPVKQRLEQAQIAALVAKFPQYSDRASQL
jgi:hypothetical protein